MESPQAQNIIRKSMSFSNVISIFNYFETDETVLLSANPINLGLKSHKTSNSKEETRYYQTKAPYCHQAHQGSKE